MAAPCRVCGVLRFARTLSHLELGSRVTSASCQIQQVRHKKGEGRFRAPPEHKEKEKWMSFAKKTKKAEIQQTRELLKGQPEDDVWINRYYHPQTFDLYTAINMHREFAQPAMLNNTEGLLQLNLQLDLRTKKKSKFMNIIKQTVKLPHSFEDGTENRVLAFVKDPVLKQEVEDLDVAFVGGIDLVKTIEKGEVRFDDFDHVVCHLDMLSELGTVRKFLRDSFPHRSKGTLGTNLIQMVDHFLYGKTYESAKVEDAVGTLKINLGRLNLTDEQLMENFDKYMESICSHRSASLGQFITKGLLSCPPSPEDFYIKSNILRPVDQRETAVEIELEQDDDEPEPQPEDSDEEDKVAAKKQ